jgi:hypothetical protein
MNCEMCSERLPEYVDGELTQVEHDACGRHLDGCEACRQELESVRRLLSLAATLPADKPDAETLLRVRQAIEAESRPRRTGFGPVLDLEELADFLRADRTTIEVYLDEIPCFELGGKLLFRRKSVEAWIEQREMRLGEPSVESVVADRPVPAWVVKGGGSWKSSGKN